MKTAIEWLVEELTKQNMFMHLFAKEIQEAKEMERKQIKHAHSHGWTKGNEGDLETSSEYYNNTYKSE
jgi:hypothetical protein